MTNEEHCKLPEKEDDIEYILDSTMIKRGLDPKAVRNVVNAINLDKVAALNNTYGHDRSAYNEALIKTYPILKHDEAMTLLSLRMAANLPDYIFQERGRRN